MAREKVLITVKTYPTLSNKYDETVCTAGFRPDGSWIRIYPVPFRKYDEYQRYKKFQWIELDLVRNTTDKRVESYRPGSEITLLEEMGTTNRWDAIAPNPFVITGVFSPPEVRQTELLL